MQEAGLYQQLEALVEQFVGLVWGLPLVFLLFGAGLMFTVYFAFPQFKHFWHAIRIVKGDYDSPEDEGEISHFQALCAALSATLGLGNIAGVAVAVAAGGPGAIFWMWVAGILGMATKFTSITLALIFREQGTEMHGGPMYTIKNGLGKAFMPMAVMYATFAILSSFGAGNMFQSNQMASILNTTTGGAVPAWLSGGIFTFLAALVLVGGIKRIGNVAGALVPSMVVVYFLGALGIVIVNIDQVPGLIGSIFTDAFSGTAAVGGFAGVAFKEVVVQGVRRAVFSNEAGMGSAAMAHAAAKSSAIQEGLVGLLGPFIDTIVVCTLTALVILLTGAWTQTAMQGSDMTALAFSSLYGEAGRFVITLTVVLFAFSTIISWSYYGEQGVVFLFGEKGILPYRVVFLCFTFIGSIAKLGIVLNLSDAVFGLLAIPNLLTNIMLSPKLKKELKDYERDLAAGKIVAHN